MYQLNEVRILLHEMEEKMREQIESLNATIQHQKEIIGVQNEYLKQAHALIKRIK